MKYIELMIYTTTEASDAVSNMLYDLGAAGVVIEDPNDFRLLNNDEKSWDYVEDEMIESMGEDTKVKGYFSELDYKDKIINEIKLKLDQFEGFGLNKGKGEIKTKEVYDEDWSNGWKKYYKPLRVGEKIIIKPTWEDYQKKSDDIIIELDPGMAFGTGTHETTVMCMKLIEKYLLHNSSAFDVGCGSGILGITSAKLGASEVTCVDIDEVSCKVASENIELNNANDKVNVICGNLLDVIKNKKADMVIANIIADIVISFTDDVGDFLKDKGIFISSGIIKDRKEEVLSKIKDKGFHVIEVLEMGEWVAIAARK